MIRYKLCCGLLLLASIVASTSGQKVAVIALNYLCGGSNVNVNEGSSINICANIYFINGSLSTPFNITVSFSQTNGTAKSGIDFIAANVDRIFPAGSVVTQSVCFTIQTIDDMIVGATKTFTVNLYTSDPQVTIGDRANGATVAVNILNIDVTTVVMNTSNIYVYENVGAVAVCMVLTTGTASTAVSVTFQTTAGTALATTDYITPSTTATIAANNIGICTAITIVDDTIVDGSSIYFTAKITATGFISIPSNRSTTVITITDNDVAVFGFWANNPLTILESSTTVQICVQMISNLVLGIPVTVELRVIGVTAKNGADFSSPSAINITFWTGNVMGTINCTGITILQDSILENNEDITLSLNSYFSYVNISSTRRYETLTIIEDADGITVGFSSNTFIISEAAGVRSQICAQLYVGSLEKTAYAYVTTGTLGSAQPYIDYIPLSLAEVSFVSGASAQLNSTSCINFTVIDDHILENNETVPLSLSSTSPVSTLQTSSTATVLIYEYQDYVEIGFIGPLFATEGVNLTVAICAFILDGTLGRNAVVKINLMNITATPGVDYEDISMTLTFTSGQKTGDSQCFHVAIYHSVIVEDTEFFSANVNSQDSGIIMTPQHDSSVITIYDDPDDKVTFGMRSSALYYKETDGKVPICVILLAGLLDKNLPVGVISTDGTAKANSDYQKVNMTINFNSSVPQGQSLCIDVSLIDDHSVEYSTEYFKLTLIAIDAIHTVIQIPDAYVYVEEDTTDVVIIGFQYINYNAYESLLSTICAAILSGTVERPVSVFASSTSLTAIENVDYQRVTNYELVLPLGSSENSTVCLNISTYNNTNIQADRAFTVTLQKFDSSVLLSASASTTVTIKQNPVDRIVLRMQDATLNVTEGINTSIAVCVLIESTSGNLTRSASGTLIPINSTAKDIKDYVMPTSSVLVAAFSIPGSQPLCVYIGIVDDNLVGHAKVLKLLLSATDPVVSVDLNYQVTTITISENPNDHIEVAMQNRTINVTEESSNLTVCVVITAGALEDSVTVWLKTYSITAVDGKDYIGGEFNLTFYAGQSALENSLQCIDLKIINDNLWEHDETFLVWLNSTKEDADLVKISLTQNELLVTIVETSTSDSIQIGLTPSYNEVVEGEQSFASICAILYQGELGSNLTVSLIVFNSTVGDTALLGRDYLLQSLMLTFLNISSKPCVNVTILDDDVPENILYLTFGLLVTSDDYNSVQIVPAMNISTIAVLDDDHEIVVGFDEPTLQVTEGINMSTLICGFFKSETGIWKTNLSIKIIAINSTAKEFEDYALEDDTVLFPSWTLHSGRKWCVNVIIFDDDITEDAEQLILQLISTSTFVKIDEGSSTVTIDIDEENTDYIGVQMQYSTLDVSESNSTVALCAVITSGILGKNVSVIMQTHSITAIDGKDYIGGQFILTYTPGQSAAKNNMQCIDLVIIDDNILENNETLIVTLNSTQQDSGSVQVSSTYWTLLLTIVENETADYIEIGIMQDYYEVIEGSQTFVSLCVVVYQGALGRNLQVMLTTSNSTLEDTALSGRDFALQTYFLTFEYDLFNIIISTPCVNLTILDDNIPEDTRYITIGLFVSPNDASYVWVATGKNQSIIAILDDDHDFALKMRDRFYVVNESAGLVNICTIVEDTSPIIKQNLTFTLITNDGTAKEGLNYIIQDAITIDSSNTKINDVICFNVTILDDNTVGEDFLYFTISLFIQDSNNHIRVVQNSSISEVIITEDIMDYIGVQMQYSTLDVSESNSTVALCAVITSGNLGENVSVVMQTHSITAIDGKDYIGGQFILTFTSGQSAAENNMQCIDLVIIDDHILENNETLMVTLNSTQKDAGSVQVSSTYWILLLTIVENETDDHIEIGMMQDYYEVIEGSQTFVSLCVVVYQGVLERNLQVTLTTSNSTIGGTALSGHDFILQSNFLTFEYDLFDIIISTPCVNLTILDDNIPEDMCYITIGLTVSPNDASYIWVATGKNQSIITIIDDDHDFALKMHNRVYLVNESSGLVNICTIVEDTSPVIKQNLTFNLITNGTAKEGLNYIVQDAITIDSSNAKIDDVLCFNVTILDDNTVEKDLYFTISLFIQDSNNHIRVVQNNSISEVIIAEDTMDYIGVQMQYSTLDVSESNSTVALCAVITSGNLGESVTVVMQTLSITAIDGKDYIGGQFILTFTPGQSATENNMQCIDLVIIDDHILENNETLMVTLNSTQQDAGSVHVSSTYWTLLLTIVENETADYIEIGMMQDYYEVIEGSQTFVSLCVVVYKGALGRNIQVMLTTSNSTVGDIALSGHDFILQSNFLTFEYDLSDIISTPCVNLTILDDKIPEDMRYIKIGLIISPNDASYVWVASGKNQSLIAIIDDDHDFALKMQDRFYVVNESAGLVNICTIVEDTSPIIQQNLTFNLITNGTAKEGLNYIVQDAITIDSSNAKINDVFCFNVTILDDSTVEKELYFTISLFIQDSNNHVRILQNMSISEVIITEDTMDYIGVQMQYSTLYVSESSSTVALCAVIISGNLGENVSVVMQTHSITAIDGKDYIGGQFILTFTSGQSAAGNNMQCIDLVIIDDHILENNETLIVTLNSTQQNIQVSSIYWSLVLTIIENETADYVEIGMMQDYYEVIEGSQTFVSVCIVVYTGALGRTLQVMLTTSNSSAGDTALSGHDFILQSYFLTLEYGFFHKISSPCVNLTILDDKTPEDMCYITIGLMVSPNDASSIGVATGKNQSIIAILDDDHGITVGFSYSFFQVKEGINMSISLCGFINSTSSISKNHLTAKVQAINDAELQDYLLPNDTVEFPSRSSGESRWCITVYIIDDYIVENSEQFTLQLVSTDPSVIVNENYSTITIQILESNDDYIEVQLEYEVLNVSESNSSAIVCAKIIAGSLNKNVTVSLQTQSITAIDGKDYTGGQFTVTFTSGQSASENNLQCITLLILDDDILENDETLIVSLNTMQQDSDVVRISLLQSELLLTITEDSQKDAVFVEMSKKLIKVKAGEQKLTSICALLSKGELGYDISIILLIKDSPVGNTAIPDFDYVLGSNNLTFNKGDSAVQNKTHCVNVTINDNGMVTDKILYIVCDLTTLARGVIIVPERNETTICVEYENQNFVVGMQHSHYTVNEDAGNVHICVIVMDITTEVQSRVYINITTSGTARVGLDYTTPDGIIINTTDVVIGDLFCFSAMIIEDDVVDNDSYFTVTIISQNVTHFAVMQNSSTSTVTILEDTADYVTIAFEQAEYLISSEATTSLTVCIHIIEGILGRNITVTVGTHSSDNSLVPGAEYTPFLKNITFIPNGATIQCINITIIVDYKSSGKSVDLFIATQDKAAHLTQNITRIKIGSLSHTSVLLTIEDTAAIIITVWTLLFLCVLLCLLSCLFLWCKKKKKKKIHPEKLQLNRQNMYLPAYKMDCNTSTDIMEAASDETSFHEKFHDYGEIPSLDMNNFRTKKEAWI